jgi:hypothetical protein
MQGLVSLTAEKMKAYIAAVTSSNEQWPAYSLKPGWSDWAKFRPKGDCLLKWMPVGLGRHNTVTQGLQYLA